MAQSDQDQVPYGSIPPDDDTSDKEEIMEEEPQEEQKPAFDFEKGYGELHSKFGEQSNEIGRLRQQTQELQRALEEAARGRQEPEQPATDYQKMLSDIADKFDNGDITYEQSLLESNRITREMTLAEADQRMTALADKLRGDTQQLLTDKEAEAEVKRFHGEHPQFAELQQNGVLEQLVAEDPLLDDLAAYYKYQAMEAFKAGQEEAARIASGSERAGRVLADTGSAMQTQPAKLTREADLKASMLAALNDE